MGTPEADQHKVSSLIDGLPTCVFAPAPYTRVVTNIVVSNTVGGQVFAYRGSLTSVPVARNSKGDSNTLTGRIRLPAGQIFYVQWSTVGDATARVSFERVDSPLDSGDTAAWAEESIGRIVVPSDAETDPSTPPYIIIAGDSDQAGNNFATIIYRTPTLPPDWEYRVQIREGVPPYESQFEIVIWDRSIQDEVHGFIRQNRLASGPIASVLGPSEDHVPDSDTYVQATRDIFLDTYHPDFPGTGDGRVYVATNRVTFWGQAAPALDNLYQFDIGQANDPGVPTDVKVNDRTTGWNVESVEGINGGAAFSTTAGAFTVVTNAPTLNFTKEHDSTRIRLDHHMTCQIDNAGTGMEMALRINGTSYRTGRWFLAAAGSAGQPFQVSGTRLIDGIPAGTYTVTPMWRRYVGAANVIWAATNSHCSFTVAEEREV